MTYSEKRREIDQAEENEALSAQLEAIKKRERLEIENRSLRAELESRSLPDTRPSREDLLTLARSNPAEFNRLIDAGQVTDQFASTKESK